MPHMYSRSTLISLPFFPGYLPKRRGPVVSQTGLAPGFSAHRHKIAGCAFKAGTTVLEPDPNQIRVFSRARIAGVGLLNASSPQEGRDWCERAIEIAKLVDPAMATRVSRRDSFSFFAPKSSYTHFARSLTP